MRNSIAIEFGFEGVPIRILLRDSRSQYAKKNLADMNIGT
jgi:predicted GTPase